MNDEVKTEEVEALDVHKATIKDLLAFHNHHCDEENVVKKFKNRKAAMMAVADLIAEKGLDGEPPVAPQPKPEGEEGNDGPGGESHREAVRRTWDDPEVRAKRAIRRAVMVDGVYYPSVRKAFEALELPMKDHIPFRARVRNEKLVEEYDMKWEDTDFVKATPKPKKPKVKPEEAEGAEGTEGAEEAAAE